ncbi:MAG: hypothetical protein RLZZ116_2323 [Planctomycetota bacterium]
MQRGAFQMISIAGAGALLALGACASGTRSAGQRPALTLQAGEAPPARMTVSTAPGLELHRWFVPIDPKARRDGLAEAITQGTVELIDSGFGQSGFEIYRAKLADIVTLQELLGGSFQIHSTRLGMLPDWADIENLRVDSGRTVFFNGRPRSLGNSIVRLWLRGWCFPTVDGARARVDVRLTTEDARPERFNLDPSQPRARPRELDGGRAQVELAPDEALVILEKPIVPPEKEGSKSLDVLPPPTVAALMLAERAIEGRATILIVTAGFADILPRAMSEAEP